MTTPRPDRDDLATFFASAGAAVAGIDECERVTFHVHGASARVEVIRCSNGRAYERARMVPMASLGSTLAGPADGGDTVCELLDVVRTAAAEHARELRWESETDGR